MGDLVRTRPSFAAGEAIPRRRSCEREDRSPPPAWTAAPERTRPLALVVDDLDAPSGTFPHWLAWGLDPEPGGLDEGAAPPREGRNDFGTVG